MNKIALSLRVFAFMVLAGLVALTVTTPACAGDISVDESASPGSEVLSEMWTELDLLLERADLNDGRTEAAAHIGIG
jgi:hypothetical protein